MSTHLPHRVYTVLLMSSLFCISTWGCSECSSQVSNNTEKRTTPVLGRITWVESLRGNQEEFISNRKFKSMLVESLGDLSEISASVKHIDISGELETADGGGSLMLKIKMHLSKHLSPFETGIIALGSASNKKEAIALVNNGLPDLAHAISNLVSLVDASDKILVRSLSAAEADEQTLALKILGHRKVNSAVEAIGNLLDDPRPQVRESAAEALARIGDEKAVPLLIGAIKKYDVRSEVRAIEAMGRIGGSEAKAYLEMTATGHEIPEVRRLSSALLEDMKNR